MKDISAPGNIAKQSGNLWAQKPQKAGVNSWISVAEIIQVSSMAKKHIKMSCIITYEIHTETMRFLSTQ